MRGYFGIGVEGISKPMNVGNLLRSAHSFSASFFFTAMILLIASPALACTCERFSASKADIIFFGKVLNVKAGIASIDGHDLNTATTFKILTPYRNALADQIVVRHFSKAFNDYKPPAGFPVSLSCGETDLESDSLYYVLALKSDKGDVYLPYCGQPYDVKEEGDINQLVGMLTDIANDDNNISIFDHLIALEKSPFSFRDLYLNKAAFLERRDRWEEAAEAYETILRRNLELRPDADKPRTDNTVYKDSKQFSQCSQAAHEVGPVPEFYTADFERADREYGNLTAFNRGAFVKLAAAYKHLKKPEKALLALCMSEKISEGAQDYAEIDGMRNEILKEMRE